MTFKTLLRASCAAVAMCMGASAFAQDFGADAPETCLYRNGRPVWHFIPAKQVANDVQQAMRRSTDYQILRDSGGRISQEDYYSGLAGNLQDARLNRDLRDQLRSMRNGGEKNPKLDAIRSRGCQIAVANDDGIGTARDALIAAAKEFDITLSQEEALASLPDYGTQLPEVCLPETTQSPDELIRSLAEELTEFSDESSSPGPDPSAPIPYGASLNPGWHYVRVTMVQSNLAYDRRFWRKYYPALYTELQFDSFGSERKAIGISAEDGHYKHDKNRVRRTLVMNQVVLPPTPYIDGEMRAEISILAVESYDYGRAFISFLSNVTNGVSSKLLSQAEEVFKILDEGIKQLAGTDAEKQFLEAGVAIDWPRPRTGYWLLLWPNKDFIEAYGRPNSKNSCPSKTPMTTRSPWSRVIQNRQGGKETFSVSNLFRIAKTGPSEVTLLAKRTEAGREGSTAKTDLYEPLDNATWSLIRVDALSTNPNWQRIPGLIDAQQNIIKRMLQFYLPDFAKSGTYLDLRQMSEEEKEKLTDLQSDAEQQVAIEEAKEKLKAELEAKETDEEKEQFFLDELTKDFQFYYGLLMSSPDLLATDKYKIIEREQLKFQRHIHVLRTTELRDQLVAEGYKRWREKVRREACSRLSGEGLTAVKKQPDDIKKTVCSEPSDSRGEAGNDAEAETPPVEEDDGASGDDEPIVEPSENTQPQDPPPDQEGLTLSPPPGNQSASLDGAFSPQLAAMRVDQSASAMTHAVDEFMATHPHQAMLASYRGPESIDGAMIVHVAEQEGGLHVKQKVAEYLSEILMEDWILDTFGHLPADEQP